MRWTRWWLFPLATMLAVFLAGACSEDGDGRDRELIHSGPDLPFVAPDAGDGEPPDAGTLADAGELPDAGTDGGTDGGEDGGADAGSIVLPSAAGWTFYGPQHGGPREVYGVSADVSGNLWVAGGAEGLFLLEPGATTLRRFTHADGLGGYNDGSGWKGYEVRAVAGGPANTVFVGYRGVDDTDGNDEDDPEWMLKSGDAARVVYNGAGISVTHIDISSPPGLYSQYPNGREKIRHVLRIVYDHGSGDVWFGGNHGVAMFDARRQQVWEHQHIAINGYRQTAAQDPSGASYTATMSGDWWGVALDPVGDVWIGGAHRIGKINYASGGRSFWAKVDPDDVDVWPDRVLKNARPEDRQDDHVSELVADSGGVWVASSYWGLARLTPTGTSFVDMTRLADPGGVTSLERDPSDGSLWVGHLWGGITRLKDGNYIHYSRTVFGSQLIDSVVRDIQSDRLSGQRRILVAFSGGVVAVYTGE
jgi:hypothetical protein